MTGEKWPFHCIFSRFDDEMLVAAGLLAGVDWPSPLVFLFLGFGRRRRIVKLKGPLPMSRPGPVLLRQASAPVTQADVTVGCATPSLSADGAVA